MDTSSSMSYLFKVEVRIIVKPSAFVDGDDFRGEVHMPVGQESVSTTSGSSANRCRSMSLRCVTHPDRHRTDQVRAKRREQLKIFKRQNPHLQQPLR